MPLTSLREFLVVRSGSLPVNGSSAGANYASVPASFARVCLTSSKLATCRRFGMCIVSQGTSDQASIGTQTALNVGLIAQSIREAEEDNVPLPIVLIDNDSDTDSTIVELSFGDRLGALLDTIKALKDLGLNVVKGVVSTESSILRNKFYITRGDDGRKVESPELLEAIRLTIINNLLQYHPESSEQLAMGEAFGIKPPQKKLDVDVATHISISKVDSKRSLLTVETADRPGLLMEIVRVISDVSALVESAEIDTEGLVAKDKFYVTYGGCALSKSMEEVLTNCLRYYLRRPDTEEDSY